MHNDHLGILQKYGLGSPTDISSFDTPDNQYECQSDGYFRISVWADSSYYSIE